METLNQFLNYNKDPEFIRDLFILLDNQLQLIHSKGYSVDINSSSIINENGDFGFSKIYRGTTHESIRNNIVDLAKLAVGTYFSLPTGTFVDYTHLPTEYIKDNFDVISDSILKAAPNDDYYKEVLVNGSIDYYNNYLMGLKQNNSQSKANSNNRILSYSTPQGRAMTNNDESAFISVAFYPIVISLFIILSYMIYILVK